MATFLELQIFCKNNKLNLAGILGDSVNDEAGEEQEEDEENAQMGQYHVTYLGNGSFTGEDILAALVLVFLTHYWMDKSWITDISHCDSTIPQSVPMC